MTKVLLGKDPAGKFRARVLEDGASLETPVFNDILFDADFPVARVFESGQVTMSARGNGTFSTTPIGSTPLVIGQLVGPSGIYVRSSYNDPSPGQITGPGSYTGGRGQRLIAIPYVMWGEVIGILHGYEFRASDGSIELHNYFWSVGYLFTYHLLAIDG